MVVLQFFFDYRGSLIGKGAEGGEEGFVPMLTFWGPLVDRLGYKEFKLIEKEYREAKKLEENEGQEGEEYGERD